MQKMLVGRQGLKCHPARDRQFHVRAGGGTTADFELPADSHRAFAHPRQAPMAVTTRLEHFRFNSAAVVTNSHLHAGIGVVKLEFDASGPRVTKGVNQSFPANAINLVTNQWPKR